METKLYKMRVKKGKEPELQEWMKMLRANSNNVKELLENEKVYLEAYYTFKEGENTFLYCHLIADSIEYAFQQYKESQSEIDKQHAGYAQECIDPEYTFPEFEQQVFLCNRV